MVSFPFDQIHLPSNSVFDSQSASLNPHSNSLNPLGDPSDPFTIGKQKKKRF